MAAKPKPTPKPTTKATPKPSNKMYLKGNVPLNPMKRDKQMPTTKAKKGIGGLAKNPVTPTRGQNKSKATPKAKMPLTGPAAVKAIQKRTSPQGVKEYEKGAKKALEKKYPGLYKKTN
jgi:hypothetical protein